MVYVFRTAETRPSRLAAMSFFLSFLLSFFLSFFLQFRECIQQGIQVLRMSGASFSEEALDFEISFIQVLLGEENHWHEECQHRQGKCADSIDFVLIRHWHVQENAYVLDYFFLSFLQNYFIFVLLGFFDSKESVQPVT